MLFFFLFLNLIREHINIILDWGLAGDSEGVNVKYGVHTFSERRRKKKQQVDCVTAIGYSTQTRSYHIYIYICIPLTLISVFLFSHEWFICTPLCILDKMERMFAVGLPWELRAGSVFFLQSFKINYIVCNDLY